MKKFKLLKLHWSKILSILFLVLLLGAYSNTFAVAPSQTQDSNITSSSLLASVGSSIASGWNSFTGMIRDGVRTFLRIRDYEPGTSTTSPAGSVPSALSPTATTTIIQQITKAGLTGKAGTQGLRGFTGLQGPKGETGATPIIDLSSFVTKSFFDKQIDGIFNSMGKNIQGLSDSLSKEVNTKLLIVTGDATIGGNIILTGTILGSNLSGSASGLNTGDETNLTILTKLGLSSISGTNTGDNAVNSLYSGLATSKQDALGFTPVANTVTVNGHALSSNVTVTPTDLGLVIGTNVLAQRTFGTAANNNTGDFEVPLTFGTGLNRTGNNIISTITQYTDTMADARVTAGITGKQNTITIGTTSQYFKGDLSLGTFPTALTSFTNDLGNYGGFLTSYTETDPIFVASQTHNISSTDITNLSHLSGTNTGDNAVNSLYSSLATSKQDALNGTGFVKISGTTISYDNSTYLTSLSGAVLTNQSTPQTIGSTGSRLAKLWATDLDVTNTITGSISGNAGTVTNGAYINTANSFTNIAPMTTLAESWIGPSSTTGIYFKDGNVGIGTTTPLVALHVNGNFRVNTSDIATVSGKTFLGTLTPLPDEYDQLYVVTPTIMDTIGRGVNVITTYAGTYGGTGINSYMHTSGSGTFNHINGIQSQLFHDGSGILPEGRAFWSYLTATSGTITNGYGYYYAGHGTTGSGAITNPYAFYAVSDPSYFGGRVNTAGGLDVASAFTTTVPLTQNGVNLVLANTTAHNFFFGGSGNVTNTGTYNTAVGLTALTDLTTGINNVGFGYLAGAGVTSGSSNIYLGAAAGANNKTGDGNVFVGFAAGYFETGSSKLFIDNTTRGSEADARTKALVYGVFDADPANQRFVINGSVGIGIAVPTNILHVTGTPATGVPTARIANTLGGTTQNNGLLILAGNDTGVATSELITFKRPDNTTIGTITQTAAGAIAFNSGSDRRIKDEESIKPTTFGLSDLLNIKVDDFTFIGDPNKQKMTGFIAQELYDIYPSAVTTNGDDGIEELAQGVTPWMIDYSKLTPLIVKSVQDLDLKLEEINNLDKENTWRDSIIAWFGNTANGIGDFFINRVHTKELCVAKLDGTEFCANGDQLEMMISGNNSGSGSNGDTSEENTDDNSGEDTDVCPNIDGIQAEIPAGDEINADGQCVEITGGGTGDANESDSNVNENTPDITAPIITLSGDNPITLKVGDTYSEAGATAKDDVDASVAVDISGTVDVSTPGTYNIKYNAKDVAGNPATEITRTVTVE